MLRKRWKAGAREYGDRSFFRPPFETVDQVLDEVADVAGWAFVLWVQLKLRLDNVVLSALALEEKAGRRKRAAMDFAQFVKTAPAPLHRLLGRKLRRKA